MSFKLPPEFKDRVNELDAQLKKYDGSVKPEEIKAALREALVISCRLLQSIDLGELEKSLNEVAAAAKSKEPNCERSS